MGTCTEIPRLLFHVRFVVVGMALKHSSLRALLSPLLMTMPQSFRSHLSPAREVCVRIDQAENYHTFETRLGALPLTLHLAGLVVKAYEFSVFRGVVCETRSLFN